MNSGPPRSFLLDYDSLDELDEGDDEREDEAPFADEQRSDDASPAGPSSSPPAPASSTLSDFLSSLDARLSALAPTLIAGGLQDDAAALRQIHDDGMLDPYLQALGVSVLNRVIFTQRLKQHDQ